MFFAAVFCVLQRDVLDGGTVGLSLSFALQVGDSAKVLELQCFTQAVTHSYLGFF